MEFEFNQLRLFKRLMRALRLFSPVEGLDCGFVTCRVFLRLEGFKKGKNVNL